MILEGHHGNHPLAVLLRLGWAMRNRRRLSGIDLVARGPESLVRLGRGRGPRVVWFFPDAATSPFRPCLRGLWWGLRGNVHPLGLDGGRRRAGPLRYDRRRDRIGGRGCHHVLAPELSRVSCYSNRKIWMNQRFPRLTALVLLLLAGADLGVPSLCQGEEMPKQVTASASI